MVLPVGDGLPFAGQARGDGEGGVDERDLDVPVMVGAPLDERQSGQDPFGVGEVLAPRRRWVVGCLWAGPRFRSRPRFGVSSTGRGRSSSGGNFALQRSRRLAGIPGKVAVVLSCDVGAAITIGIIVGLPTLTRDVRTLVAVSGIVIGAP